MKMQLHKLAITICPISNTTVYPVYQTCHHHPKNPLNITSTFSLWADCSVSWSPSTKTLSRTTLPLSFFNCGTYLDGTDIRCWDISPEMLVLRIPNQENTRKKTVGAILCNCHLSHPEKLWCQQESKHHSDVQNISSMIWWVWLTHTFL